LEPKLIITIMHGQQHIKKETTWSRLPILGWPRKLNSLTWKMSITKNHK